MSGNTITNPGSAVPAATDPAAMGPETIVEQLRAMRQFIPDYGQLPIASAEVIRRVAHVDPDFTQAAINSVGASASVESALGRSRESLRDEADQANRWTVLEDELRAMLKGVISANLVRKHRLGLAALQVYGISRQLVRKAEHNDLLPHVEEMRRLNKFGKRRAKGSPKPAPAPQSEPQTAPKQ